MSSESSVLGNGALPSAGKKIKAYCYASATSETNFKIHEEPFADSSDSDTLSACEDMRFDWTDDEGAESDVTLTESDSPESSTYDADTESDDTEPDSVSSTEWNSMDDIADPNSPNSLSASEGSNSSQSLSSAEEARKSVSLQSWGSTEINIDIATIQYCSPFVEENRNPESPSIATESEAAVKVEAEHAGEDSNHCEPQSSATHSRFPCRALAPTPAKRLEHIVNFMTMGEEAILQEQRRHRQWLAYADEYLASRSFSSQLRKTE